MLRPPLIRAALLVIATATCTVTALSPAAHAAPASKEIPTTRIIGGEEVPSLSAVPAMVHLHVTLEKARYHPATGRPEWAPYASQECGGTLLSWRSVLTAAHCIEPHGTLDELSPSWHPVRVSQIDVRVGSLNRNSGGVTYHAANWVRGGHMNWTLPNPNQGDWAVLSLDLATARAGTHAPGWGADLSRNTLGIQPVQWDRTGRHSNEPQFTAVGWGDTAPGMGEDQPTLLRRVELPRVTQKTDPSCGYANEVCAGNGLAYGEGGHDICSGDSGGPLLAADANEPSGWVQVGISSWNRGCHPDRGAAHFTKVAAYAGAITQAQRVVESSTSKGDVTTLFDAAQAR